MAGRVLGLVVGWESGCPFALRGFFRGPFAGAGAGADRTVGGGGRIAVLGVSVVIGGSA